MCFFYKPPKDQSKLVKRFGAKPGNGSAADYFNDPTATYNGFTHPALPVITAQKTKEIQFFEWGLLPDWAKEKKFQANTLNARIESLHKKPSFSQVLENRCLVPAENFWEWQWQDSKGRDKIKHLLEIEGKPIFAFAGLWSEWRHPETEEVISTYTIITTAANALMAKIHNIKKRMPVILHPDAEDFWLQKGEIEQWNDKLTATPLYENRDGIMQSLF